MCDMCSDGGEACFICLQVEANPNALIRCMAGQCRRGYHALCLSRWSIPQPINALGGSHKVWCPAHSCLKCRRANMGSEAGWQSGRLIKCALCPSAFHQHCIPSEGLVKIPGPQRLVVCTSHSEVRRRLVGEMGFVLVGEKRKDIQGEGLGEEEGGEDGIGGDAVTGDVGSRGVGGGGGSGGGGRGRRGKAWRNRRSSSSR